MRPGRLLVNATLALLTLIWGTTWAAIRVSLEGIPPIAGVALRFAIAGVVLLLLAPLLGVSLGRQPAERRLWVVNALFTFCGSYGIVYWAEQWVPSGLAATLFATFPLFVALLAHWLLPGERLTLASASGTVLGLAGIAVIFSSDFAALGGPRVAFAAVVLLASPFISAIANVAMKKWGEGIPPLSLAAVPMVITGVVMGGLAAVVERGRPIELDLPAVLALLYLSLAGSALAFTLYFWLLRHLPATRVSLVAYTSPVVAVAVGALFLGEPVTGRTLAGSALVVLGVALAVSAPPLSGPSR